MKGGDQECKNGNPQLICYKKCPRCETLITNCPRYQNQIKRVTIRMNLIKKKAKSFSIKSMMDIGNIISKKNYQKLLPIVPKRLLSLYLKSITHLSRVWEQGDLHKILTVSNTLKYIEQVTRLEKKYPTYFKELSRGLEEIEQQLFLENIPGSRLKLFFRSVRVATMYLRLTMHKNQGNFSDNTFILPRVKYNRMLINESLYNALQNSYEENTQQKLIDLEFQQNLTLSNGQWYECAEGHLFTIQKGEKLKCTQCNSIKQ